MADSQFYNLTLDTRAPQGCTLSGTTPVYSTSTVTITKGDADTEFMYLWQDTNATGTMPSPMPETSEWLAFSGSKDFSLAAEGANYVHAIFMDAVGNISAVVDSNKLVRDQKAPEISNASLVSTDAGALPGHTTTTSVTVSWDMTDVNGSLDVSGVKSYTITGDIEGSPVTGTFTTEQIASGSFSRGLTLNSLPEGVDEEKRDISITITDAVGNVSAATPLTIQLDTVPLEGDFDIKQQKGTEWRSVVDEFIDADSTVRIDISVTAGTDVQDYKITGDVACSSDSWVAWGTESKTLKQVTTTVTSGSGDKTVHVWIRDDAGNVTDLSTKKTTVDTAAPTLTINGVYTDSTFATEMARMSDKTGHNELTLKVSITDDNKLTRTAGSAITVKVYAADKANPEEADLKLIKTSTDEVYCKDAEGTASVKDAINQPISVTYTQLAAQFDLSEVDGKALYFVIKCEDDAQKEGTSNSDKLISVDTVAPTGTIAIPAINLFTNHAKTTSNDTATDLTSYEFVTTISDAGLTPAESTLTYKAWIDAIEAASAENIPAAATSHGYTAKIPYANIAFTASASSAAALYLHVQYTDDVANVSYVSTAVFRYDITAPVTHTISGSTETVYGRENSVTLGYGDDTIVNSKVRAYQIYGDVTADATSITPLTYEPNNDDRWTSVLSYETQTSSMSATIYLTPNLDASTVREAKNVKVRYIDFAGNVSDETVLTMYLEAEDPAVTMTLFDNDGWIISDTTQGTKGTTASLDFYATFVISEDTDTHPYKYKLSGALTAPSEDWVTVTEETKQVGEKYVTTVTVTGLKFTAGQGEKKIKVTVKDVNDNIGTAEPSTIYDTAAPTVTVANIKNTRISKLHTKRNSESNQSVITDTTKDFGSEGTALINYNDLSYFEFYTDKVYKEYKVCVNEGKVEQGDIDAMEWIGKNYSGETPTQPCIHMHGTGETAEGEANKVCCLINGTVFAAEPKVLDHNATYEVIVYVLGLNKVWSEGYSFTLPVKAPTQTFTAKKSDGTVVEGLTLVDGSVTDVDIPENSVGMDYGVNGDARDVATYEITANVAALGDDVTSVDVWQYK